MDLTRQYPRSVHDKVHGLVQIGRTTDKAKATAHGNIGEYHYNCGMDQSVFTFLGIDSDQLLDVVKKARGDAEIDAYVKKLIDKKSPQEIEVWNREYVTRKPEGESLKAFLGLRDEIAPDRKDVTSWPDLLDLDEKRPVPHRVMA
jgi:hypothetical protein